jgi:cellulose synthase/poly-beta-1,6-N-acetylglucosamine synthase-like glycosyltransferase
MIETSIIIVAKNEAQNIGACLKAIYSQKYARPLEVILVNSGSATSDSQSKPCAIAAGADEKTI